jgi:hypothetical protein
MLVVVSFIQHHLTFTLLFLFCFFFFFFPFPGRMAFSWLQIMGSTVSLRCAWCKRTIHKACFEGKSDAWGECDMGQLSTFILPSTGPSLAPPNKKKDKKKKRPLCPS